MSEPLAKISLLQETGKKSKTTVFNNMCTLRTLWVGDRQAQPSPAG